jgi:hypothetical protein
MDGVAMAQGHDLTVGAMHEAPGILSSLSAPVSRNCTLQTGGRLKIHEVHDLLAGATARPKRPEGQFRDISTSDLSIGQSHDCSLIAP